MDRRRPAGQEQASSTVYGYRVAAAVRAGCGRGRRCETLERAAGSMRVRALLGPALDRQRRLVVAADGARRGR